MNFEEVNYDFSSCVGKTGEEAKNIILKDYRRCGNN
jgi:hypothetical protein